MIDSLDYFHKLEEIISFKDAPLGVPNEIPLAIMSKELKKRITVVLSGEGADELLGGYGKIYRSPFDYSNIDKNCGLDFYDYFIEKYEYVPRAIRDVYLMVESPYRQKFDDYIRNNFSCRENEENVFRFFHEYHVKGLLQRIDTTTMYSSVEARVPFLDHELVEFAYREIPYSLKLKWNSEDMKKIAAGYRAADYSESMDSPKYLLRRLGFELLPEETVTRRKMGFPVPLNQWFPKLEGMAYDVLGSSEWLDTKKLKSLISDCSRNFRSGQLLWMFINIEFFRKLYFEKEWRY